jgi:predicted pyridoxine 5'-phosphate oxidase superfamily flavin-nucleotide-binding protein
MNAPSPAWHTGEQVLQQRAGVKERLAELGAQILRDHMPEQHRAFFAQLPLVYTGTVDDSGQPWASLLAGAPGFLHSPTPRSLRIEVQPLPGDPAAASWREGAPVALLGLQAHTGRRNRLNGRIVEAGPTGFGIEVGQSFGNCPKYIHPRRAVFSPVQDEPRATRTTHLDEAALRIVRAADTFFIASAHPAAARSREPAQGVDVSHRGGPVGFVRVQDDGSLLAPDYTGNFFFNTLGNLQLEARCGLLFVDHASGERLHVAARGTLLPDAPDPRQWAGAARLLRFEPREVVRVEGGLPLAWQEMA